MVCFYSEGHQCSDSGQQLKAGSEKKTPTSHHYQHHPDERYLNLISVCTYYKWHYMKLHNLYNNVQFGSNDSVIALVEFHMYILVCCILNCL